MAVSMHLRLCCLCIWDCTGQIVCMEPVSSSLAIRNRLGIEKPQHNRAPGPCQGMAEAMYKCQS